MQQYDIVTKVLMEQAADRMIEQFLGMQPAYTEMIEELPQESVSLKRADYILRVTDAAGKTSLVLWEFLSQWKRKTPLHVLDYTVRALIKFDLPVIPVILLMKPSGQASDHFEAGGIHFTLTLIKVYEIIAEEFMQHADIHLLPFVSVMKGYEHAVWEADKRIYESKLSIVQKADLLTAMSILTGLNNKELAQKLVERRRDIMIQSYAYDLIKQEGVEEGNVARARKDVYDVLEARFEVVPQQVMEGLENIDLLPRLEQLLKKAAIVQSLEEFRNILTKFLETV